MAMESLNWPLEQAMKKKQEGGQGLSGHTQTYRHDSPALVKGSASFT